ncbi:MAG: Smr/MutS family protein [Spirochaetaceae bacterium]|nr:Smr/MutS family protein [Spirochaetaceae bacterium]
MKQKTILAAQTQTHDSLDLLEFGVVREAVAGYAKNAEAERRLLRDTPYTDERENEWMAAREKVRSIHARFLSGAKEPAASIPDISGLLPRLAVEREVLSLEEIWATGLFLREGATLLAWLEYPPPPTGLDDVQRAIFAVIDKDGSLRDLPQLRAVMKSIAALETDLQRLVKQYYANAQTRAYLQSDVPSERDGRLVVALKAQHRHKISGLIREVSATGQTLFIEPADVVEKNNALVIEKRRYDIEVNRILAELTARVGEKTAELRTFHEDIVVLEVLRAKAKYSLESGGVFAERGAKIVLKQARHPLLGAKAVPLDFEAGADCHCVVITGPNAGGKTVTLKTAGLFALMNQAGLALPVAEGTRLPFFDAVYADIGDDQSIMGSLSTFSAHIKHLSYIMSRATEHSLVLLDELGSGTDPLEGGAIAMAAAGYFADKGIATLVTTHHGALKNYAWTHAGMENASAVFDEETLSPAYRIAMGVPGESHALLIAEKNGLPAAVVEKAKTFMHGDADVSALINTLREKHHSADRLKEALLAEKNALIEEKRRADLRELRLRQRDNEIQKGVTDTLQRFIAESRKELEHLVKELREGEITREKTRKMKGFIAALEAEAAARSEQNEKAEQAVAETAIAETSAVAGARNPLPGELVAGAVVLAGPRNNRRGVVKRLVKKGLYAVEFGSVTVTLSERDLRVAPGGQTDTVPQAGVAVGVDLVTTAPLIELNLRGLRTEDALAALRTQLDAAVINGMRSFAVVHGKGDGILSRAAHDYLATRPEVADFAFSRPEAGGFGRTEVTLKD